MFFIAAAYFLVPKPLLVPLESSNKLTQLCGLKQQKWNLSQFLEPEFQNQGVDRATLPPKALAVSPPLPLPASGFLSGSLAWDCMTHPRIFTRTSLCVCGLSPSYKDISHWI